MQGGILNKLINDVLDANEERSEKKLDQGEGPPALSLHVLQV